MIGTLVFWNVAFLAPAGLSCKCKNKNIPSLGVVRVCSEER